MSLSPKADRAPQFFTTPGPEASNEYSFCGLVRQCICTLIVNVDVKQAVRCHCPDPGTFVHPPPSPLLPVYSCDREPST